MYSPSRRRRCAADPRLGSSQTALAYARTWRTVDASNQVLGRMATRIAITLMGKHKPIYDQASASLLAL